MRLLFKLLIRFYQRFISKFTRGSCRFYPTCSEYGIWQFENNSFFKAIYFTITRILRCNQHFDGGIDYPIVSNIPKKSYIQHKKIKVKFWFVPTKNNKYYVIRNWEIKENNE